jgi:hypothetical protein
MYKSLLSYLFAYYTYFSTLMMETVRFAETPINFYETTRCHIPEHVTTMRTLYRTSFIQYSFFPVSLLMSFLIFHLFPSFFFLHCLPFHPSFNSFFFSVILSIVSLRSLHSPYSFIFISFWDFVHSSSLPSFHVLSF